MEAAAWRGLEEERSWIFLTLGRLCFHFFIPLLWPRPLAQQQERKTPFVRSFELSPLMFCFFNVFVAVVVFVYFALAHFRNNKGKLWALYVATPGSSASACARSWCCVSCVSCCPMPGCACVYVFVCVWAIFISAAPAVDARCKLSHKKGKLREAALKTKGKVF